MLASRMQFRSADLLAATVLVATITIAAVYLPSASATDGNAAAALISKSIVFAWIIGAVCFCRRRLRAPAVVAVLLICTSFSWRQAILLHRLRLLEAEVPRIVAYVEAFRKQHEGECPLDLQEYDFQRPELRANIQYLPPKSYDSKRPFNTGSYAVCYHPNSATDLSYWFTSAGGYWYDDD